MTVLVTLQAEAMSSAVGYGARVISDATAAGGKALLVDSAVTVTAKVTLPSLTTGLVVRARTDGTNAYMTVAVDGSTLSTTTVAAQTWAPYRYSKGLEAGPHEVTVLFRNPDARNLYLDSITFEGVAAPPVTETKLTAYLTGYGYPDNSPANSDAISHPTATRPHAGGTGTYADPITMAVGYVGTTPDLPYGAVFYVPTLRRYFRIEDLCGACHGGPRPAGTSIRLDCWVGGKGKTAAFVDAITAKLTGTHAVIRDPAPHYVVTPGELAVTGVTLYGETPVIAA